MFPPAEGQPTLTSLNPPLILRLLTGTGLLPYRHSVADMHQARITGSVTIAETKFRKADIFAGR